MTSKRKIIFILGVVLVVISGVFLFWRYNTSTQSSGGAKITEEQRSKLAIGVVKTTNFTNKTTILGYDKDLNLVVDVDFPFKNVGNFSSTTTFNEKSYFGQVIGHAYKLNGNKILEISLKDFSFKTYEHELYGLDLIAENDTNVFGYTNSKLTVLSKDGNNKKTIELKKADIDMIFASEKNLFVIGSKAENIEVDSKLSGKILYIYDNELKLVKMIGLEKDGFYRYSKIGNKYYFANYEDSGDKNLMYIFDENTFELEKVDLKAKNVLDIIISGDYYILGSGRYIHLNNGGITFKNIKTGEEIFHKLESGADKMFKIDNYLYVLHTFEDNKDIIAKYEINGTEIKKVKEVEVKIDKVLNDNQFVTGMFPFEK